MGSFIRSIRFPEDLKNEIEKEMKESGQKYNTVPENLSTNVLDNETKKGRRSAGQRRNRRKTMLHKDIISSLSFCQAKLFKKPDISILFGVEKNQSRGEKYGKEKCWN